MTQFFFFFFSHFGAGPVNEASFWEGTGVTIFIFYLFIFFYELRGDQGPSQSPHRSISSGIVPSIE
jgi:hypothetical protein